IGPKSLQTLILGEGELYFQVPFLQSAHTGHLTARYHGRRLAIADPEGSELLERLYRFRCDILLRERHVHHDFPRKEAGSSFGLRFHLVADSFSKAALEV